MDKQLSKKAIKLLNSKDTKVYNKHLIEATAEKRDVTIVIPCYNAASTIEKCINSVINQTFNFNKIELIIVDDNSSDNSRDKILLFTEKHPNIVAVFLKQNTGNAAMPRNIGIELATAEKIMFLDSDDYLDRHGIEHLYNKMEENHDDLVIGRTIKVTDSGQSIHAEFVSYKERNHINPFDFPYIFYHMGPPSKLMKTTILKDNYIRFPEIKYAEDKYFFFHVFLNCTFVSIITKPIYYVNRQNSNQSSLTKTTSMLEKRKADLYVLKKVVELNLSVEKEKVLVKRILEYDLIRYCNNISFIRNTKRNGLIKIIKKALKLLKNRPYNIIETFDSDLFKVALKLLEENRDKDFIQMFSWNVQEKNKNIVIKENIAYLVVDFLEDDDPYKLVAMEIFVRSTDNFVDGKEFVQQFEIYTKNDYDIHYVLIRDRKEYHNELKVPVKVSGNRGEFRISYEILNNLKNSSFYVFIRYNDYQLTNIKRLHDNQVVYENKVFDFYTTKAWNLGFSLKSK